MLRTCILLEPASPRRSWLASEYPETAARRQVIRVIVDDLRQQAGSCIVGPPHRSEKAWEHRIHSKHPTQRILDRQTNLIGVEFRLGGVAAVQVVLQ